MTYYNDHSFLTYPECFPGCVGSVSRQTTVAQVHGKTADSNTGNQVGISIADAIVSVTNVHFCCLKIINIRKDFQVELSDALGLVKANVNEADIHNVNLPLIRSQIEIHMYYRIAPNTYVLT